MLELHKRNSSKLRVYKSVSGITRRIGGELQRPRRASAADFFGPVARCCRPELTGVPPPTQWRRRRALVQRRF